MTTNASSSLFVRAAAWLVAPFLLTLAFALWPHIASAATITVDGASCTLPDAITAANVDTNFNGCTLVGAPGVDTLLLPPLTSLATGPFRSDPELDEFTATPSVTSTMIISGGMEGAVIERSGSTHYRLFFVDSSGNLTLEHVTVRYGSASRGGAIHNVGALTLLDSTIISNAAWLGGAISNGDDFFNKGGTITITNSHIISNFATAYGGGIYNVGGTVIITNSGILSNTATSQGGGIFNQSHDTIVDGVFHHSPGILTLTDATLAFNLATTGGGIFSSGEVTITNSDIRDNTTLTVAETVAPGSGGGFWIGGGNVTILDSDIFSNTAINGGGGIHNQGGRVELVRSHIISNTATSGGGIFNTDTSTVTLRLSEVRSNTATKDGGGVFNDFYGFFTSTNSTIIANTAATGNGGGIFNHPFSSVSLINSAIIANLAMNGGGIYSNYHTSVLLVNSDILTNTATENGGGIYHEYSSDLYLWLTTTIRANRAMNGGGLYNGYTSKTILMNSDIIANTATQSGGGIYQYYGSLEIARACLLDNEAGDMGGALLQHAGGTLLAFSRTRIGQSSIVNNTDTAVTVLADEGATPIEARDNWWGATDGPAGNGPGTGDGVSDGVIFTPFLTSPVVNCSMRETSKFYLPHIAQ